VASRTVYWVSPHGCQWKVQREGSAKPSNVYQRKSDALQRGMDLARANRPSQLKIQRGNGTIENERTYNADPFPPRG